MSTDDISVADNLVEGQDVGSKLAKFELAPRRA
jgi:hypothetical protein